MERNQIPNFSKNCSHQFVFLFVHDHSTKLHGPLSLFFLQCTTIWLKIKDLINLIFLLVHDHSTKVRGHSYFLISYFLNCANISFAILKAILPLYFVRSIHRGAALILIFCTLYSWKCCSYISYAMSMAIRNLGLGISQLHYELT